MAFWVGSDVPLHFPTLYISFLEWGIGDRVTRTQDVGGLEGGGEPIIDTRELGIQRMQRHLIVA